MKRFLSRLCVSSLMLMAGTASATVVDDFSGDLSAYTKSIVLTNSEDDEATSLSKTSFVIDAGTLELSTSDMGGYAYQTVFLRDDYSLGIGQRLQVDLSDVDLVINGLDFGLCVAGQKTHAFGDPRENFLTSDLYDNTPDDACSWRSYMFNGTDFSYVGRTAVRSTTAKLYIDRISDDLYLAGFVGNDSLERYNTTVNYSGGANAVGFYVDTRLETSKLVAFDNLQIVDSPIDVMPGVAPISCYDYSAAEGTNVPEKTFDATWLNNGKPVPSTMWVAPDDTLSTPDDVTGHIVYDMGSVVQLDGMTIWARDISSYLLPENIKIFGFADDDPTNILGNIDGIETDPNIIEIFSGTLESLNYALSQDVTFDIGFTGRYIGLRVDSSYPEGNFQIGEVRFHEVPVSDVPGDANNDGNVDSDDAAILASHWLMATGATWGMGDFNGDGKVNDIDATIMAANWHTANVASVPEPCTSILLITVSVALLGLARRKRR